MHRLLLIVLICLTACTAPLPPVTPSPLPLTPTVIGSQPTTATVLSTPLPTIFPTITPTQPPVSTPTPAPAVHPLFDPQRLSYDYQFSGPEIQAFLEARNSPLATIRTVVG
ncbi:MAG: peptidase M23, partial [Chloroflexi bacterium]